MLNFRTGSPMKQSMRDVLGGEVTLDYLVKRLGDGWKVSAIEWSRESAEPAVPVEPPTVLNERTAIPYGFHLTNDGVVKENPAEVAVLILILDEIVKERRLQDIATDLNLRGYLTRSGTPWRASDVFNLLPRLIDAGPSLLKSSAWQNRHRVAQRTSEKPN